MNSSIAGARGIVRSVNGSILTTFEWGLGTLSNNRAEAFALLQGLYQLKKLNISNAMVFGDSSIVINLMTHDRPTKNIALHQTISRCRNLLEGMKGTSFYHILCKYNKC